MPMGTKCLALVWVLYVVQVHVLEHVLKDNGTRDFDEIVLNVSDKVGEFTWLLFQLAYLS